MRGQTQYGINNWFGEGNGNPLQYSCLENPMDGGAWWAAVYGVATEQLHFHFSLSCIGEGNGNPLQRYCLKNPRDGGAWWAAVYGVGQSRTQLKRLSSSSSMNCILPGSSVHGIFQAKILEWFAVPSFRVPSRPRDRTHASYFSCIGRQVLYCQRHPESIYVHMLYGKKSLKCIVEYNKQRCPLLSVA